MAWGTPSRERRVLKAGHSSIAVTLPKPWAEAMNLRPGDLVVFDQNDDGTLYLKPAPSPGAGPAGAPYLLQARAFETPGMLERLVTGAYRVGHDAIEIRTELPLAPERVEELLDAARHLLGVSVVAQEPNRVLLQNFIDPSKYGLPQLVQRMKMILVAYMEEAEELLQRKPRSRRLPSLSEEAHRVLALLVRQLFLASRDWSLARRIGSPDPRQLLEWRVVVHALEELGEILRRVVDDLNSEPPSYRRQLPELAALVAELRGGLKSVFDSLMHPTLSNACEAHAESIRLADNARELVRGLRLPARRSALYQVPAALERGAGRLTVLAQVAVDRAVSNGSETILIDAP
jgi:AbrB family looped-hinge helix DNA binding protein